MFCYDGSILLWRHNERDVILYHQPHDCLLDRLFMRSQKHQGSASLTFDRWIPRTKGQLRVKYFHLLTSSWHAIFTHPLGFISHYFDRQLYNYPNAREVTLENMEKLTTLIIHDTIAIPQSTTKPVHIFRCIMYARTRLGSLPPRNIDSPARLSYKHIVRHLANINVKHGLGVKCFDSMVVVCWRMGFGIWQTCVHVQ